MSSNREAVPPRRGPTAAMKGRPVDWPAPMRFEQESTTAVQSPGSAAGNINYIHHNVAHASPPPAAPAGAMTHTNTSTGEAAPVRRVHAAATQGRHVLRGGPVQVEQTRATANQKPGSAEGDRSNINYIHHNVAHASPPPPPPPAAQADATMTAVWPAPVRVNQTASCTDASMTAVWPAPVRVEQAASSTDATMTAVWPAPVRVERAAVRNPGSAEGKLNYIHPDVARASPPPPPAAQAGAPVADTKETAGEEGASHHIGIGWRLFFAGWLSFGIPWFVGAVKLFMNPDPSDRPGLIACIISAGILLIVAIATAIAKH